MIKKISQIANLPEALDDKDKILLEVSYKTVNDNNSHSADESLYYTSYQTQLANIERILGLSELRENVNGILSNGLSSLKDTARIGSPGNAVRDRTSTNYYPGDGSLSVYSNTNFQNNATFHGISEFRNNVVLSCTVDKNNPEKPILHVAGVAKFDEVIQGTAYRAQWGDLAEIYAADNEYEPGTLVKFGGIEEITIADNVANAVVTSCPGMILNSSEKEKLRNPTAIALTGRVPVKISGPVRKFDNIVLSRTSPGVGVVYNYSLPYEIIGKALEDNDDPHEKLVMCAVRMKLI